jgi:hypothetical protein
VAAPDCADRGCCVSHAPPHLLFLLFCGPSQSCGVLLAAVVVCLCGVVRKEGEGGDGVCLSLAVVHLGSVCRDGAVWC